MLTIGEFAAVTHLSVRTLRRYHADGLLEPARVDPSSGYRYYAAGQIPTAQVIHRLRQLDVPLPEVRAILGAEDVGTRGELVAAHLRRLESELERTRSAVASLRRLLDPAPAELTVRLRSEPARIVAGIADTVALDDVLAWYDAAMNELDAAAPPGERTGPPGGQYANELFAQGRGSVLVYRPVRTPAVRGRVAAVEIPAAELAVTVHAGAHDDIAVTYGRLGSWVVEHALAVAGPVHETYLVGPRDTADPDRWRTEIGWPVFRVAG